MEEVARDAGKSLPPFRLRIDNEIPITKGLGSSATACVAGAAAADFQCWLRLTRPQLLEIATAREGHPDNVAPALMGGLVASISGEKILCARTDFPADWTVVAVTPHFELETKRARAALPELVLHRDAVYNVQRAAFLMAQLTRGCREGVREAMRDRLHQPYRSPLLPGLQEILGMRALGGRTGWPFHAAGPPLGAWAVGTGRGKAPPFTVIFNHHARGPQGALRKSAS